MNHKIPVLLNDGVLVEAVYYPSGTLCLSSQAGCAVACPFCASGSRGLLRNLTFAELQRQIEIAESAGCVPKRLTVSGIGEPLHNPEPVAELIQEGRRKGLAVSLTTSGGPLGRLREYLTLPHNGLMISLHSARQQTRRKLVPHAPDADSLQAVLNECWSGMSQRNRRKLGINYLLLEGVNDSDCELDALIAWLRPFPEITLHLLSPSRGEETGFLPSRRRDEWYESLRKTLTRVRRGNRWRQAAEGGCGTLFARCPTAEHPRGA